MMKKGMAWLLVLMLLTANAAFAAETYTVDEKVWGQLQRSGATGEITFSVAGNGMTAVDDALFQQMKSILPGTRLSFGLTIYDEQPQGGYVNIHGADGSEKQLQLLYNDEKVALGGNAIAEQDAYYLLDNSGLQLIRLFQQESATPGITDLLALFAQQDAAWQEKAQARLMQYETMLNVWMNDYAGTSMGREGEALYTELTCTIPPDALKAEIKELLHVFYSDGETLALLSPVLDGTGGEIYLHPAMEGLFADMVDGISLQGDVEVTRRFDSKGQLMLDHIHLPLGTEMLKGLNIPFLSEQAWQQVTLNVTGTGDVELELIGEDGRTLCFSALAGEDGSISGRAVWDGLKEDGTVEHTGYDYQFTWQAMDETYSLQTDICERLMQGILQLTPDSETKKAAQRITLDVKYTTKSRGRSASLMVADLVWMDMSTQATIALSMNLQTGGATQVQAVDSLTNTIHVDTWPLEERQAFLEQVLMAVMNQAVPLPEM